MWDIFISHASEDKEQVARPLAEELRRRGLSVWYDEFSLSLGDSLRRSIDKGLAQSRFGVIVLSKSFFAKDWTQRELDGLTVREVSAGKVILPIWHGVSQDDVARYSPVLADKLAIVSPKSIPAMADAIEDVVTAPADLPAPAFSAGPSNVDVAEAPGRRSRYSSILAAIASKTVPMLVILWLQWILAEFLLCHHTFWLGRFGSLGPLWLAPLSYLIVRFISSDVGLASVTGAFTGGIVSVAVGQLFEGLDNGWGIFFSLLFGVYFGAFLSAYWASSTKQMRVIWALLSTMLMIGGELITWPDLFYYAPVYAFEASALQVVLGIVAVIYFRVFKNFISKKIGSKE